MEKTITEEQAMAIEVMGSGCPTCKKQLALVQQAVKELGLTIEVGYVTDVERIIEMGVMRTPVIAIDGKAVATGFVRDVGKIKELIRQRGKK